MRKKKRCETWTIVWHIVNTQYAANCSVIAITATVNAKVILSHID